MAIFLSDTFTDTESTDLTAHTGEVGASWTKHGSFTDALLIQSNRAGKDANTGTTVYYASALPPSNNYIIEAPIVDIGNVNRASGICMCIDTAADNMIIARRQTALLWQFGKIIGGILTSLETIDTAFSAGATTILKVVRDGDKFSWSVAGALSPLSPHVITDSQFQSPGRVGLRASNIHSGTGYHVDSISAYTPDVTPYFGGGHSTYQVIRRVSSY